MSGFEIIIASYGRDQLLAAQWRQLRCLYPKIPICWGLQGEYGPELDQLAAQDQKLRIVHLPRPQITAVLNACLRSSPARYVVLLDDDALPVPGWLEAFAAIFAQFPELPYAMGREIRQARPVSLGGAWARLGAETLCAPFVPARAKSSGRIVGWMTRAGFLFGNFALSGAALINSPRGCNLALNRALALDQGGFEESFQGTQWGFETEFGLRLQRAGLWGQFCPEAVVLHAQAPDGGTRARQDWSGLSTSLHNHALVNRQLGPWAWIGALPRLARTALRCWRGRK